MSDHICLVVKQDHMEAHRITSIPRLYVEVLGKQGNPSGWRGIQAVWRKSCVLLEMPSTGIQWQVRYQEVEQSPGPGWRLRLPSTCYVTVLRLTFAICKMGIIKYLMCWEHVWNVLFMTDNDVWRVWHIFYFCVTGWPCVYETDLFFWEGVTRVNDRKHKSNDNFWPCHIITTAISVV